MGRHLWYAIVSLVLVVVQTKLVRLVSLEEIAPDILVIWIVYLALKEGQLPATVWGFAVGLVFDLVTGEFVGLSALTKTVCGFAAGYFHNENKTALTVSSYRFLLVVLTVSLIHNTIYFLIFTQGSEIGLARAVFQIGLATTFYTTTLALLPMFALARRYIA